MPNTWLTAADVPPASGTGQQLRAMRDFIEQGIGADDFVRQWLDGRRTQMDAGDRGEPGPGARIENALDELFFAVDDYDPSPADREPEWIDADQLRDSVREALTRIDEIRVGGRETG